MATRLSVIATRTGDQGTTGLGDGSRVDKDAPRIAAMGDVDELNTVIGMLRAQIQHDGADEPTQDARPRPGLGHITGENRIHARSQVDALLSRIQHHLFDLGAELCIPGHTALTAEHVAFLDTALAEHNATLTPLKEFILPGGTQAASLAHLARTVCRRAERSVITLNRSEPVNEPPRQYLNRLSDLCFVLARVLNKNAGGSDVLWENPKN